jgi:hypothetical protein
MIYYEDCYGNELNFPLGPLQVINICACESSIIAPPPVNVINLGLCVETTPTPTPTISVTPSVSVSPVISDCPNTYCLSTNYSGTSIYDGIYTSTGTYNGREYYVGSFSGVVYYNNVSWCLSSNLGGECILYGKTPCFSNCPDIENFNSGVCVTPTPTPTPDNCLTISFEALFDCDVATPTPTPTPTITLTPTPSPTTPLNPCSTVDAVIVIVNTVTPTPTPTPSSTPTIDRNVEVSGSTTFTIVDTEFSCDFVRQITDCASGNTYYVAQSMRTTGGTIVNEGEIISANVSGVTYCFTYNGNVNNQSPTLTLNTILDVYTGCTSCYESTNSFILTESGEYLLTEDGDNLIY